MEQFSNPARLIEVIKLISRSIAKLSLIIWNYQISWNLQILNSLLFRTLKRDNKVEES